MKLPRLGSAVIINNLALEVPDTVQDVKDLSSTLETIGFKVESQKDFNTQVTFQNVNLDSYAALLRNNSLQQMFSQDLAHTSDANPDLLSPKFIEKALFFQIM